MAFRLFLAATVGTCVFLSICCSFLFRLPLMKSSLHVLTAESCFRWCAARGVVISPLGRPAFQNHSDVHRFTILPPDGGNGRIALVSSLLTDQPSDIIQFSDCLFWLHLYDIGTPHLDEVGIRLLRSLIGPVADDRWPLDRPGVLVPKSALVDARAMASVAAISQFEASLVMPSEGVILFISHHEVVDVICHSDSRCRAIEAAFEPFWKIVK